MSLLAIAKTGATIHQSAATMIFVGKPVAKAVLQIHPRVAEIIVMAAVWNAQRKLIITDRFDTQNFAGSIIVRN